MSHRATVALVIAVAVPAFGAVARPIDSSPVSVAATASATPIATRAVKRARSLYTQTRLRRAQRYAAARLGTVAFAVLGADGALRGFNRTMRFPSASVVKAMLLVAALRAAGSRPLTTGLKALLGPMIRVSDNAAAIELFARYGRDGLDRVAKAAGMRKFSVAGHLFDAQLTAADQARFFLRIDRLVPAAHRAYARELLSSIVAEQSWGIASVARTRGFGALFKGGWRTGITHQVALLERDGCRIALAVLTSGAPSQAYGEETIAGIAARLLTPASTAARRAGARCG